MSYFRNMEQVIMANEEIGQFWFSGATMAFFNSRIETALLKGEYFVTSERENPRHEKIFTIRVVASGGKIDTHGYFQGFTTLEEALIVIDKL